MATCPNCRTSSRTAPDAITVEQVLAARPLGTWSLSGAGMKTSAVATLRMSCRCGWSILGRIEGDSFVGDPDTQTCPSKEES
jgi:hypothetical protein